MTFADVNAALASLRDGLRTQVDAAAIGDVNIQPPASDDDEISFVRLVGWCYAVLFEAGRVSLLYLLRVPFVGEQEDRRGHEDTRILVRTLRTALVHNLGFADRDLDIRRQASRWFVDTCVATYPGSREEWSKCFSALCGSMLRLVLHCTAALNGILKVGEDRDSIFEDLRLRLSRNWDAFQFDAITEDAAARLGERINAKVFRERRVAAWREFLDALPEDADLSRKMTLRIEREVYDHFQSLLPFTTAELISELAIEPGPKVKRAVALARQLFEDGIRDRVLLLDRIRSQFGGSDLGTVQPD